MVGWNYPKRGNLHDLILESHLHPFTCLSTLSAVDKKNLRNQGLILCKEINLKVLREAGIVAVHADEVMKEIGQLCGN